MESFNLEKPARPVVAPPEEPLDPEKLGRERGKTASLSGSSTRRDGDITENEAAESADADSPAATANPVAPSAAAAVPDAAAKVEEKQDRVSGEQVQEEPEWISGVQLWTVMAGVTMACFLMFLDTSIIATAIPQITNDFHSLGDVGWYGSAYQLASAAIQPLTGKIYTHFSSKWTFLTFFLIFELGSLICGVAPSSTVLIIGRAVAGVGVSGLMNGGLTIIAGSVPLEKRPALIGVLMGISQFGFIGGPLVGGAFTQFASWRWCFYVNLPIGGLVAALLMIPKVPEQIPKPNPRSVLPNIFKLFDLTGFALIAGAAVQLLLAMQFGGNQYPWRSSVVIGLFCGAGATSIAWFVWNYRLGDEALIPFSMMRKRVVWSAAFSSAFLFGTVFCSTFFLPIYFQAVLGVTPFTSGVYLLPTILTQLVFAVVSGILVSRLGYYIPWAIASSILTTIGTGLFGMLTPVTPKAHWVGFQIVSGAGRGMGIQMPLIAVQSVLPPDQISVSMSLLVFTQYLLGAVFLTLANTIFDTELRSNLGALPDVNAEAVIAAGATAFRSFVSLADLDSVLQAYSKAINPVFYYGAGLGIVMFLFSWGLGWNDVRKKKVPATGEP